MQATAARTWSLDAPWARATAAEPVAAVRGPAADVLSDADLVFVVLQALAALEPSPGLLPLQVAARLSMVHPAWRDAAARVGTRLDACPAAALNHLSSLPRAAADARMATLRAIDMGETATHAETLATARALAAARPPRTAALVNPSVTTPWLRDLERAGVSFDTVLCARGYWHSGVVEAVPRTVTTLSLCARAGGSAAPHPGLLSATPLLEDLTLIGFCGAEFAAPLPAGLRTMRLVDVRADLRRPTRVAGWRDEADAAGTRLEIHFEPPGKAEARAGARGALVDAGVAGAAASVVVRAPGREAVVAAPPGPLTDAEWFVQALTETGRPLRLDVRADGGVLVGAATPADVAAASRGTPLRVDHGPGWMVCRVGA